MITKKKWDMTKLFEEQEAFDEIALTNAGETRDATKSHRLLAVVRETSEVLEELPAVFKFWKKEQKRPNMDKIEDELADVLHFLISIGIDVNANPVHHSVEYYGKLQEQFLAVMNWGGVCRNMNTWDLAMAAFRGLIDRLGVSEREIEAAFRKKDEVNRKRQKEGY